MVKQFCKNLISGGQHFISMWTSQKSNFGLTLQLYMSTATSATVGGLSAGRSDALAEAAGLLAVTVLLVALGRETTPPPRGKRFLSSHSPVVMNMYKDGLKEKKINKIPTLSHLSRRVHLKGVAVKRKIRPSNEPLTK